MKPLKTVAALAAALLLAASAGAADLAEYQRRALRNRPAVAQQRLALEASETDRDLARTGYRPAVDLSYTATLLEKATFVESRANSVATAAVTWNLFRGFRDTRSIDRAGFQRAAESHRLRGVGQDVALEVSLRYLEIYTRRAELAVERDTAATLEQLRTDAGNRYELGLIKKNDLLKFQVDLDNATIAVRRAEAEVAKAVRLLARAVAEPVDSEGLAFTEFAELPAPGALDPAELERRMLAKRSELLALRELEAASGAAAEVERAGNYPSLDLTASYRNYDDDWLNPGYGSEEDALYGRLRAQVQLTYRLYDGDRRRLRAFRAEQEGRALRQQRLELEDELRATLANLEVDYGVSRDNAAVALEAIGQAEENLRITELSYKEGLSTETDLLDATANLSRARFNHVAAKSEAFTNRFLIRRAVDGFEVANAP